MSGIGSGGVDDGISIRGITNAGFFAFVFAEQTSLPLSSTSRRLSIVPDWLARMTSFMLWWSCCRLLRVRLVTTQFFRGYFEAADNLCVYVVYDYWAV